jgi:hypothetical protein
MDIPDQVSNCTAGQNLDVMTRLEHALIKTYLESKGYTLEMANNLPLPLARKLRVEASVYASCRLAEVEARNKMVDALSS